MLSMWDKLPFYIRVLLSTFSHLFVVGQLACFSRLDGVSIWLYLAYHLSLWQLRWIRCKLYSPHMSIGLYKKIGPVPVTRTLRAPRSCSLCNVVRNIQGRTKLFGQLSPLIFVIFFPSLNTCKKFPTFASSSCTL